MRRALVLTDESARHPFRASLPPHVCMVDEVENRRSWREALAFDASDARQFAMTYSATFLATTAFFF